MICSLRRNSRMRALLAVTTFSPLKRISPASGSIRRRPARPAVDLPQPDSPTRPKASPSRTSNEMPSSARTVTVRTLGKPRFTV
jgi:hypothetical protein